jgi:hypothetical protein
MFFSHNEGLFLPQPITGALILLAWTHHAPYCTAICILAVIISSITRSAFNEVGVSTSSTQTEFGMIDVLSLRNIVENELTALVNIILGSSVYKAWIVWETLIEVWYLLLL